MPIQSQLSILTNSSNCVHWLCQIITLQNDLNNLEKWGMSFNATKCYILSVKKSTTYFNKPNNTILKEVENNPYLGLSISNDLKWTNYITTYARKHLLQLDSFVATLNIAQLNVDVQHIYLWSDRHLSMEQSSGTHTYSQTLIKSKKYSERLFVLSAAITNLGTVAVFQECSRTLNCHVYKREGSNSDWHSCSRWLRGSCRPYHHPLILSQYQTNAEFEPHVLVTLRVQTLWHRMNWTITNALAQNVEILTFIYRNSFFVRTVHDWNQLDNSTVT